jgi:hypothetical protein
MFHPVPRVDRWDPFIMAAAALIAAVLFSALWLST